VVICPNQLANLIEAAGIVLINLIIETTGLLIADPCPSDSDLLSSMKEPAR